MVIAVQNACNVLPLLPHGEKCRATRGDEGVRTDLLRPPHPALRATFSPLGRRESGAP